MEMTRKKEHEVSLPTKNQVETERKRYRRQKAYNKALRFNDRGCGCRADRYPGLAGPSN